MDESLELKKLDRTIVELIIAKELNKLTKESAIAAVESINSGKYVAPNSQQWARKIIAIVKEHSL